MPRYRKRKTRKGRVYKRKAASKKTYLPLAGFPKQKVVRLKFVQEFTLTSGISVSATKSYNANGMYDPDVSVGGHQPRGFDEWMAVYSHYNVIGSKVLLKCIGGSNDAFCWGCTRVAVPHQMSGLSLSNIVETRFNKGMGVITADTTYLNTTPRNQIQSAVYSQKKQHGQNATSRSDLIGSNAKNPDEITAFDCWIVPTAEAGVNTRTGYFMVSIEYIALMTEPRILPQS